ncbi:AMP-binding protein, partial [Micrococcus luteus]|uniref:AMP-binding protein n=1 Tax=Micrococcus luteus TaxID=1270 RepID=UPI00343D3312
MTADANRRLLSLDLLDEDELDDLDVWANREVLSRPAPVVGSLVAMFAAHVAGTPDAVAVSFAGGWLSYRELDEASDRLAGVLSGFGAGPGERVVVLSGRSVDAVVAIFAVLKTGAAYVPVDPVVPDARLGFIVADAAPVVAIVADDVVDRFGGVDVEVLSMGDPRFSEVREAGAALPVPAADDVAYLIYTSGTTGVPKGVAVTHRNVTQL